MRKLFFPLDESISPQARNAFLIATLIAVAHFVAAPYYLFLAQTFGNAQFYTLAAISFALGVLFVFGAVLSRRGQPVRGILLLLGILAISYPPISAFLLSGLGAVLGVALMVAGPMIAFQILPQKPMRIMMVLTFISGIVTFLADVFGSAVRPALPGIVIQVVAASVVGMLGFFILRQYRDYTLRPKLIIGFLAVSIIPISGLAYYNNLIERQNLTNAATQALTTAAQEGAGEVDTFIIEGLNVVRTYAKLHSLHEYLLLSPEERAGSELEASVKEDLLTIASYDEVFITSVSLFDINGNHVADTDPAEVGDDHAGETIFAQTVNVHSPYVSPVYIEDGIPTLSFSTPVSDEEDNLVGVLRVRYKAEALQQLVAEHVSDFSGGEAFAVLLDENHIRLGDSERPDQLLKSVAPLSAETLARLQTELRLPPGTMEELSTDFSSTYQALENIDTQPVFSAEFHEGENVVEHTVAVRLESRPWVFAFGQSEQTFLAPLHARTRTNAIVGVLIAVLVAAIGYFISQIVARPIMSLTAVARQIADGNITLQANIASRDEIGVLSKTFNTMTTQLKATLDGLEQRVVERTRNLELAAEVGRTVSQVRALDVMLKDAVELIRKQFNLYYVQVYLADSSQTNLILQSGTGTVGEQLISRGHRLPLNSGSINGRAATEKRSVVISDTTTSATFKPNPLLPNTRSEMAVPLLIGDTVVGVLDMQSEHAGVLSQDGLPAFEALAGQLAIAIQNATLLAETERARAEVEKQAARLVGANWKDYLDAVHKPEQIGFLFDQNKVIPLVEAEGFRPSTDRRALMAPISVAGESLGALIVEMDEEKQSAQTTELVNIVARQMAQQIENLRLLETAERYRNEAEQAARRLTLEGWQRYVQGRSDESLGYWYDLNEVHPIQHERPPAMQETTTLPLKARDETVGKLAIQGLNSDDKDALELANAVADRLGAHIENLRLAEQTAQAFVKTKQLSRQNELILDSAGEGIFGLDVKGNHTFINPAAAEMLGYPVEELTGRHSHSTWHHTKPNGSPYPAEECPIYRSLHTGIEQRGQEVFIRKDGTQIDVSFTATPIFEGDDVSGAVVTFTDITQQKREQETIAQRARELAAVAEISSASARELDIQKLLETVVHLTQRKFGLYHAHVFIFNEATQILKIAACGWKEGDLHEGTHGTAAIPIDQEQSLVARAARSRQAVIVNDVHSDPGWLPNPLLPDTASEMAVPLVIGDMLLGVLDVQSDRLNAFSEEDANIQATLASQVATSLQNARSFARAQQQAERESMLNAISQKIQSATTVEAVLQIAARELGHALGAPLTIAQLGLKSQGNGNGRNQTVLEG